METQADRDRGRRSDRRRAIILPGVHLAKGTVVAAGAVVTKSTEPYTLVAGVPARCTGQRQPPAESSQARKTSALSSENCWIGCHCWLVQQCGNTVGLANRGTLQSSIDGALAWNKFLRYNSPAINNPI